MKIYYWVVVKKGTSGVEHFSVTGEGSIEEECYADAVNQVKNRPGNYRNFEIQKFSELS
jgi:hypothetical protein